jgi:hypothetical protein
VYITAGRLGNREWGVGSGEWGKKTIVFSFQGKGDKGDKGERKYYV